MLPTLLPTDFFPVEEITHTNFFHATPSIEAEDHHSLKSIDDQKLIIKWRHQKFSPAEQKIEFKDGVEAWYDHFYVKANLLSIDNQTHEALAKGDVAIVHPLGFLKATQACFNWKNKTGNAEDIKGESAGIEASIKEAKVYPNQWILKDVNLSFRPADIFHIESPEIKIIPGQYAELDHPKFKLFNILPFSLSSYRFSLSQWGTTGFRLPSIAFRQDKGWMLSWDSSFYLTKEIGLSADLGLVKGSKPSYGAELFWGSLPYSELKWPIAPLSEIREKFSESYWDNVAVLTPQEEDAFIRTRHQTVSVSSQWNQGTEDSFDENHLFTKKWDVAGEIGGPIGKTGYMIQARRQDARLGTRDFLTRNIFSGTFTTGIFSFGEHFESRFRLDGMSFVTSDHTFSWARGQIGFFFKPSGKIESGIAISKGITRNSPIFRIDRPYSLNSLNLRTDIKLGHFHIGILCKYDLPKKRWIDDEVGINAAIGAFEPYIVWKKLAGELYMGMNMRISSVLQQFKSESLE